MGVLYDNFRAADAATVVDFMDQHDGGSPATSDDWPADAYATRLEPAVTLGKLIGFIVDEPWTPGL